MNKRIRNKKARDADIAELIELLIGDKYRFTFWTVEGDPSATYRRWIRKAVRQHPECFLKEKRLK